MNVRIRKEKDHYLAYFADSRKLLKLNRTGAKIIDGLYNHHLKLEEIAREISDTTNTRFDEVLKDAQEFLDLTLDKRVLGTYPLIEQELLESPVGVEIETNSGCNLRCRHCYQGSYSDRLMETGRVKEIIDILFQGGVFELSLIGGEPLLHPDMPEILEYCNDLGFSNTLVTNATLFNPTLIDQISEMPYTSIKISLEGVGEVNDNIRGSGVFGSVNRTISLLLEKGIVPQISCTLHNENLGQLEEFVQYCSIRQIPLSLILLKPFKKHQFGMMPAPEEYFELSLKLEELKKRYQVEISTPSAAIEAENNCLHPRKECIASLSYFSIDIDENMITCPVLQTIGHYKDKTLPKFGKDYKTKFKEDPIFTRFRKRDQFNCQARALIFSHSIDGADPYGIDAFRAYKQKILQLKK